MAARPSGSHGHLPRETDAAHASAKQIRQGLNRDWFCGNCGGYHPKGQVVCDGTVRNDHGGAEG
jgi:hypothetical protein